MFRYCQKATEFEIISHFLKLSTYWTQNKMGCFFQMFVVFSENLNFNAPMLCLHIISECLFNFFSPSLLLFLYRSERDLLYGLWLQICKAKRICKVWLNCITLKQSSLNINMYTKIQTFKARNTVYEWALF